MIAGQFGDAHGAAAAFSPINVWDMQLKAGKRANLKVPCRTHAVLIAQSGSVSVNESPMKAVELALFDRDGNSISISLKPTQECWS
ncbi:MAG: hypothetical protein R3C56_07640 [Pirellulaceae bacterium]